MTPTEINIAIAEACGLNPIKVPFVPNAVKSGHCGDWFTNEAAEELRKTYPNCACPKVIPDYHSDLNAMAEAENVIDSDASYGWRYYHHLNGIVCRGLVDVDHNRAAGLMARATAPQRAEAFLRTIGKWREE